MINFNKKATTVTMKLKTLRSQFPSLPEPVIENHEGFLVVRDDLVEGGTKRRALTNMLANMPEKEVVYPVTAHGYGQLALAFAGADTGKKVTLFMAKRKNYKDVPIVRETMEKTDAEYHLVQFPNFLNVVMARAKTYVENTPGAKLMPLGFDTQEFSDELAKIAKRLPLKKPPKEVWLAAGTGALARALKKAWPKADRKSTRLNSSHRL